MRSASRSPPARNAGPRWKAAAPSSPVANASAALASPAATGPPTSASPNRRSNRSAPVGVWIRSDGRVRAATRRLPWHGLVVRRAGQRGQAVQQAQDRRVFFALGTKTSGLRRQIWLSRLAEL